MKKVDIFTQQRIGTGADEWAEETFSFEVGCELGCHYCWAAAGMIRRKRVSNLQAWLEPETNLMKVKKGWRKHDGVIMFPGTHNITSRNLENSIKILLKMLSAGNYVLITIKPSLVVVQELAVALKDFIPQFLFRFTIGSHDDEWLNAWEVYAPGFDERHDALKQAYEFGCNTSVAAEPLLGGIQTALRLVELCSPWVTHDIWFGFMRNMRKRVVNPSCELQGYMETLNFIQSGPMALLLERLAARDPAKIKLKDSVRQAAANYRRQLKEEWK